MSTLTCTCVCGCRLGCPVMCGSCTTTTTTATTTTTIVETVAPSTVAQPKTTHSATTTHPATTTNAGHASNCVQVAEGSLDRQLCECDLWGSATEGTVLAVLVLSATFYCRQPFFLFPSDSCFAPRIIVERSASSASFQNRTSIVNRTSIARRLAADKKAAGPSEG